MKSIPWKSILISGAMSAITVFAQTVPFSTGRIAISSDGNQHDKDDWGATAATLMILASQNAQNKLAVYTHSDHIWGSSGSGEAAMALSADETASKFGFDAAKIVSAAQNPTGAYNKMRDAILASSADDPLTIIGAGPMHVIGKGLNKARQTDASRLQYVRVISHSKWNNEHSDKPKDWEEHTGWTWDEMIDAFSGYGVIFDKIEDQNAADSKTVGFATHLADDGSPYWEAWHFLRDYSAHSAAINEGIQFVYSRIVASDKADISDCGMAYYLFTGDQQGGPAGLKAMLDNGFGTEPSDPVDPSDPIGTVFIKSKRTENRIRPLSASEGSDVVQYPGGWSGKWLQWEMIPTRGEYFYLRSKAKKQYLYMPDGAPRSVVKVTYVVGPEAEWRKVNISSGVVRLENRAENQYIQVDRYENFVTHPEGNIQIRVSDDDALDNKSHWLLEEL
ncbi:RICIN domain-containing protein [Pontiella agarivorans]|uniref:Uncharacterized protein n=1 Tax=Pontiella agarivorans TaxID=3038953 RepID=A0ABU5MY43_9BACT|nr:hypothetical protein [Pontiella agarivorans]MDZ8119123.1 hypothetical protein [Pontiella agarivorans]